VVQKKPQHDRKTRDTSDGILTLIEDVTVCVIRQD
jgi:hypothetical protein